MRYELGVVPSFQHQVWQERRAEQPAIPESYLHRSPTASPRLLGLKIDMLMASSIASGHGVPPGHELGFGTVGFCRPHFAGVLSLIMGLNAYYISLGIR